MCRNGVHASIPSPAHHNRALLKPRPRNAEQISALRVGFCNCRAGACDVASQPQAAPAHVGFAPPPFAMVLPLYVPELDAYRCPPGHLPSTSTEASQKTGTRALHRDGHQAIARPQNRALPTEGLPWRSYRLHPCLSIRMYPFP